MECGTYVVDSAWWRNCAWPVAASMRCNLGAVLAPEVRTGSRACSAYIVDPVTVDEWQDCARISGSRWSRARPSGTRSTPKRWRAVLRASTGANYADLRLVIVHMGSGITVSAHRDGRMIDNNTPEEGPFGPDRTGSLPVRELIKLCFSGSVPRRSNSTGWSLARAVCLPTWARATCRKWSGASMPASGGRRGVRGHDLPDGQRGRRDGGRAQGTRGCGAADGRHGAFRAPGADGARVLEWIAPITVYPGEDELQALAEGVFRVLDGEEEAKRLHAEPEGAEHARRW